MKVEISRRKLLALLLGAGLGAIAYKYVHLFGKEVFNVTLPAVKDPRKPSFSIFYALSQIVTFHENLDRESAKKLYPVFMKEPWGSKHIVATYKQLRDLLASNTNPDLLFSEIESGSIGVGQKWFAEHLLTTWYTGIYYYEKKPPRRLLYEEALLLKTMSGFVPLYFLENLEYGSWSNPPANL